MSNPTCPFVREPKTQAPGRLKLADGLKARRSRKKLTQVELAKSLGSSQSRVAKMEAGDPSVSVDLLVRSLIALGADSRDIAKIIASR